ncbi:hypothetical protein LTR85_011084 [Meristemomyces frigidus]|nr:hypothetical protein LTR85_011084 [Meristemomyces frigidus]
MAPLNLTFGVELEFLCVYPPGCFDTCVPNIKEIFEDSDGVMRAAGPAIFHALQRAGIPATGHESLDDEYTDAPSHSRWRVEGDCCDLSQQEAEVIPEGFQVEDVELSSRKFDFFRDDWRSEIKAVLDNLAGLEASSKGCRFITNESTGFHVHIGNGDEKIPLRAAKNIFELATAFERAFDLLNTAPRITPPSSDGAWFLYAPPSFFHLHNGANVKSGYKAMLYDWLASIEERETYEGLGSLFQVRDKEKFPYFSATVTHGHNSAYNFDNLFAAKGRYEAALTKTIEFRGHTGTLDFLEIVTWVLLTMQMVKYGHEASDVNHLALCAHGVDLDFELRDVLSAIGCHPDVIAHYLNEEDMIAGILPNGGTAVAGSRAFEHFVPLAATNEDEQLDRSGDAARKAVMDKKDYGFQSSANVVRIPVDAIAKLYQNSRLLGEVEKEKEKPWASEEYINSKAKFEVYRHLAKMYNGEFSEQVGADMEFEGPCVSFQGVPDMMEDDPEMMELRNMGI